MDSKVSPHLKSMLFLFLPMERTRFNKSEPSFIKLTIPDAINFSPELDYTQIPNSLIRNPELSAKAKIVLFILLSNKTGWVSYKQTILSFIKEREFALDAALVELEEQEFLIRVKYRMKSTKQWVGSFWGYTNQQGVFNIENQLNILDEMDLEPITGKPITGKPITGKPITGKPITGKPGTKKINNKKTNKKNIKAVSVAEKNITSSLFEEFWMLYPKKSGKGTALNSWEKICRRPPNKRPTWKQIKRAILQQKKTPRWSGDRQYIPNPSTWLNQNRWLDDPAEMTIPKFSNGNSIGRITDPGYDYSDDIVMD